MYYIYPIKNGNPVKDPIAKAPTDVKARRICVILLGFNDYPSGLWAEDKATRKFFMMEHFGKGRYLYTNNDSVEKTLDAKGNVIRPKPKKKPKRSGNDYGIKGDWRPFEGM